MRALRSQTGFTLIELMIVVAIIGVLAAIAYPSFKRFQLRSKAGEAKLNLTAIRSAQGSYFGEYGTYIVAAAEPSGASAAGPIAASKRPWRVCPNPIPNPMTNADGFCIIGFAPEGPTFFDYEVWAPTGNGAIAGPPPTPNNEFFAVANSDIDGDTFFNEWGIQVPQQNGAFTPPVFGTLACTGNTILDGTGIPGMINQVGPCSLGMGYSVF